MKDTILEHLPTPPLVADMLGRFPAGADRTGRERDFKLSYYFGGMMVAAVVAPGRLAVVASGPPDEVGAVLDAMPRAEVEKLTVLFPEPLAAVIADLPGREAVAVH